ncbi:hypothetical protein L7F22_017609 [Adiantum nelumboides]|nr:hypothetical protein [Adiantum nelumboides]
MEDTPKEKKQGKPRGPSYELKSNIELATDLKKAVDEIARITIIVNDMGNYGCYNDCSTATSVPMLAMTTIVIRNYAWFEHKWLLLRPGVLLGAATGIGMLLIVGASILAWLHLDKKLLTAQVKQKYSSMDGLMNLFFSKFSQIQKFEPKEGQQIDPTVSAHGDGMQFEKPPNIYGIRTEDNADSGVEVQANVMHQPFTQENSPGDPMAESRTVEDCLEEMNPGSTAFDVIKEDAYRDVVPMPLSDDMRSQPLAKLGSSDKKMQSDYALDSGGYLKGINLENESTSPICNVLQAIHSPDLGSSFQEAHIFPQLEDSGDLNMKTIYASYPNSYSTTLKCPLRWAEQRPEDDSLAHAAKPNPDFCNACHPVSSIGVGERFCSTSFMLPTNFYPHSNNSFQEYIAVNEALDETTNSNGIDGYAFPDGLEPPDQESLLTDFAHEPEDTSIVDQKDGLDEPMPFGDSSSISHSCSSIDGRKDNISSADATQNLSTEYMNQSKNELQDCDDSVPFGDSSSSSSHSCASIDGKTDSTELAEVGVLWPNPYLERPYERNTGTSFQNSNANEITSEQALQLPELKLVLELSEEAANTNEGIDPLEHVDFVFSSLETSADGSLVAVLSQRKP